MGVGGVFRGGLYKKRSGTAPVSQQVPVRSKMDPQLTKAEPISNAGGASVKKVKILHSSGVSEEKEKNVRGKVLQTPRSQKKEGDDVI